MTYERQTSCQERHTKKLVWLALILSRMLPHMLPIAFVLRGRVDVAVEKATELCRCLRIESGTFGAREVSCIRVFLVLHSSLRNVSSRIFFFVKVCFVTGILDSVPLYLFSSYWIKHWKFTSKMIFRDWCALILFSKSNQLMKK